LAADLFTIFREKKMVAREGIEPPTRGFSVLVVFPVKKAKFWECIKECIKDLTPTGHCEALFALRSQACFTARLRP